MPTRYPGTGEDPAEYEPHPSDCDCEGCESNEPDDETGEDGSCDDLPSVLLW